MKKYKGDPLLLNCESGVFTITTSTIAGGEGRIKFSKNATNYMTLVVDNADEVRDLSDELRRLAEEMEMRIDHFCDIVNHQLRWYVACCRCSPNMRDRVDDELNSDTTRLPHLSEMTRDQLIEAAVSYNEDHGNTAVRIKDSVTNQVDGWPRYRPITLA